MVGNAEQNEFPERPIIDSSPCSAALDSKVEMRPIPRVQSLYQPQVIIACSFIHEYPDLSLKIEPDEIIEQYRQTVSLEYTWSGFIRGYLVEIFKLDLRRFEMKIFTIDYGEIESLVHEKPCRFAKDL